MGFVNDQRVVLAQARITLRLGQQHAIGHQLDGCAGRELLAKADLVADMRTQRRAQFLRDPGRHRRRCNAPGLRMADQTPRAATGERADLGQLRRLARTGLAADDHHRVLANRDNQLIAMSRDRQRFGEVERRQWPAFRRFHGPKL
jgi:hypothetical protein